MPAAEIETTRLGVLPTDVVNAACRGSRVSAISWNLCWPLSRASSLSLNFLSRERDRGSAFGSIALGLPRGLRNDDR